MKYNYKFDNAYNYLLNEFESNEKLLNELIDNNYMQNRTLSEYEIINEIESLNKI